MAFAGFERGGRPGSRWTRTACSVDALEERLADGLRPKLIYVIPEFQNPTGRTLHARAPPGAGRAVPPPRRADPRGRRLPRDVLRRRRRCRRCGRSRPTSSCRPARSRRSSSPACGSAGRSGRREVIAQLAAAKQTTRPVRERARPADASRSTAAPGTSSARSRPPARSTRRTGGRSSGALREHMPDGVALERADRRLLHLADAAGRAGRERAAPRRARGRRRLRARAARSTPATTAAASCGCRSATSPRTSSAARSSAWRASSPQRSAVARPDRRARRYSRTERKNRGSHTSVARTVRSERRAVRQELVLARNV